MKRIIAFSMMLMLVGGLAFSQAQDPGFSNTVITGFGNSTHNVVDSSAADGTDAKFSGIQNYFTANVDIGKLTIAGDIVFGINFVDGFEAGIGVGAYPYAKDWNFNVVMKPFKGFDVGVGTNLDWQVGPAPTNGPSYSAYDVPYYAGLMAHKSISFRFPFGGGFVNNHFAYESLAVRYAYEDIIQVGFALNTSSDKNFNAGIGVKANILDLFTIGFAYNGNFKTSDKNSLYFGSTISAIKNVPIDIWLNIIPNGTKPSKLGNTTIGGRVGFTAGSVRIVPEFSVTFYTAENKGASMYIALDAYGTIAKQMLLGLNASWGLGSDPQTNNDNTTAGARLNINPYFIWNLNESNKLSIGVSIMPVWWQADNAGPSGDDANVYWSIPIAWRVEF